MKRLVKRRSFILLILLSFFVSACSFQKDVNVESVAIVEDSVPESIFVGGFDKAGIKALITYEDGTSETVNVDSKLLKDEFQEQLNIPGEYEIEILLKGKSTKLKIKVVEETIVHEVKFFNAYNELVSMQLVKDGEDAKAPEGNAHLISGYTFVGWDRNFTKVSEDINVYGIYSKITEVEGDSQDIPNILLTATNLMKENVFNVLYIDETSSQRIEETQYYDSYGLERIEQKITKGDKTPEYYRYSKDIGINEVNGYFKELFDSNEEYFKSSISSDDFFDLDIYAQVKGILTSAESIESSFMISSEQKIYKLVVKVTESMDGLSYKYVYEFAFSDKELIYLKTYREVLEDSSTLQMKHLESRYYSSNVNEDEVVSFPSSSKLNEIASKFKQGTITTQETVLETEHFSVELDANVYVPAYFSEYIEVIYDTLEKVSGLKFANQHYNPGKIAIEVAKVNNPDSPETEHGSAYAHSIGARIHVSSGDILLGNSYAIVHELSHILMYSQSSWTYSQVYVEGFAEYTSYKAVQYLEKYNIEVAKSIETSKSQVGNMSIYGNIYSQSIEYWIENPGEARDISANGAYAVGFRLMSYLDHEYDDYSSWIFYYENKNPYHMISEPVDQRISLQEVYNAMLNTYGEAVFDGFYGWLKINESSLFQDPWRDNSSPYDLTSLKYSYIYPYFVYNGNSVTMTKHYKFTYNDLYINIDETRNYLANYKGKDVSNLKLQLSKAVAVELYNSNNVLIESKIDSEFSLVGVSYIKLVGSDTLGVSSTYTHGLKIVY